MDSENTSQNHSYYAATAKQADGAVMVMGWYDLTPGAAPANHPDTNTLTPISPEDWQRQYTQSNRLPWQIVDGKLVAYTPSTPAVPLREQARQAFQAARTEFQNLQMMGEDFGPLMQDYMKGLNAIIKGTDTTTTALPVAPADPTT